MAKLTLPDWVKKILMIPFYYRAEVIHTTVIVTQSGILDMDKYKASSVSFIVPNNKNPYLYDTANVKSIPLAPGDAMLKFSSGVPNVDKSKYEIVFQGNAGTQKVLYVFISSVSKYIAVEPKFIEPCKEE
jgi:hypothetical protein